MRTPAQAARAGDPHRCVRVGTGEAVPDRPAPRPGAREDDPGAVDARLRGRTGDEGARDRALRDPDLRPDSFERRHAVLEDREIDHPRRSRTHPRGGRAELHGRPAPAERDRGDGDRQDGECDDELAHWGSPLRFPALHRAPGGVPALRALPPADGTLVGINHVALEVGSIDEALAFWERLFGPLTLRGRSASMAFVDMGDQFVALSAPRAQAADVHRHVGIVVDDKEAVRAAALAAGVAVSRPPVARPPRSVGEPPADRRLPGDPVHEGAGGARRHGARGPREDGRGACRASGQGSVAVGADPASLA